MPPIPKSDNQSIYHDAFENFVDVDLENIKLVESSASAVIENKNIKLDVSSVLADLEKIGLDVSWFNDYFITLIHYYFFISVQR